MSTRKPQCRPAEHEAATRRGYFWTGPGWLQGGAEGHARMHVAWHLTVLRAPNASLVLARSSPMSALLFCDLCRRPQDGNMDSSHCEGARCGRPRHNRAACMCLALAAPDDILHAMRSGACDHSSSSRHCGPAYMYCANEWQETRLGVDAARLKHPRFERRAL